jgi:hypothetical protein
MPDQANHESSGLQNTEELKAKSADGQQINTESAMSKEDKTIKNGCQSSSSKDIV